MKTFVIASGTITLALVVGLKHFGEIGELRDSNSRLKSRTESVSEIEGEIERLQSIQVNTNAIEELRDETVELMRLRAEASRLRQLSERPGSELKSKVEEAKSSLTRAKAAFDREVALIIKSGNEALRSHGTAMLARAISNYLHEYGRYPNSLDPLRRDFTEMMNSDYVLRLKNSLPDEYASRIDVKLEDIELLPPPIDYLTRSDDYVALREINPRKLSDGMWQRVYGIVRPGSNSGGYMNPVKLEDGDFEKWEREFAEQNSGN